jgi:S-adenosylmethionine-diacylglycerol 3-amino-3-carboxypropyl transferase
MRVSEFAAAASHDSVRYSQVWEDHALVDAALNVKPGDDVLSIAGAGCNVLSLLLAEPRSIAAVDVSPAQTALLELKLVALARLEHPEFAAFLGARPADDRAATYERRLRDGLSDAARDYWDEHPGDIESGVIGCGLLDRYVRAFVEEHVARLVDSTAITAFLELEDPERQQAVFERELAVLEPAVRACYGREGLSGRARDASQFLQVGDLDVGAAFWRRFVEVATTLPARQNFYLEYLLTGGYRSLGAGPPYLAPANFERLRELAGRITIYQVELGQFLDAVPEGWFAAANLSDVFEYLSPDAAHCLLDKVASRLQPGGRVAYWDLFLERPSGGPAGLEPLGELAAELFARDRVPFSGGFHVAS